MTFRISSEGRAGNSIDGRILALALPAIINNITVPLLGIADTAIAGHLGSADCIGAIAVGAMMMNVIYWLCGFLRAGTSGLTAQAFGAGDFSAVRSVLRKALRIAAGIFVIVLLAQRWLLDLFLLIISPEGEVTRLSSLYFAIEVWAVPAHLSIMAMSGWFIGRQNTVVPMFVSIGVNVVNILLSLILVFVFDLGFTGIAVGTLAASWLGCGAMWLCVRSALRSDKNSSRGEPAEKFEITTGKFFGVSADLFLRSACIMSVSFAMTSVGARLGNVTLAANAVMNQFFLFFSYFMDGFAFAGEALVGKAVGEKSREALQVSVRALMRWGVWMAILFFLLYLLGDNFIVSLLTNDIPVREAVDGMHWWLAVLPPITVAAFIFDGVFIGWARTRPLLVTTLAATVIFFSGSFLLPGLGNLPSNGLLWTSFEAYLLLRGILLVLVYRYCQRKSLIL